ncbi:MAG: hypothetical protein JNM17_15335 [Archangium sp.]|nr:hypothetical protein [Archangium sp.]
MRALILMCVFSAPGLALADSPLTSIDFHEAYANDEAVKAAKAGNTERVFSFLAGGSPNDRKLAVANALGWSNDFATGFISFLAQSKDVKPEALGVGQLTPSQLFAVAYLVALSNYLELNALDPKRGGLFAMKPIALMQAAATAQPTDFTVQYTLAIVKAQRAMAGKWCDVFSIPKAVENAFPPEKRNLKPEALKLANDYLVLYEDNCEGSKAAQKKNTDELNQYYSLSTVGSPMQVVGGTQGGVVVWDSKRSTEKPTSAGGAAGLKPIAIHPGFICRGMTINLAVWIGCEKEVVRWEGVAFTTDLSRTTKGTGDYYQLMKGPHGEVWVRLGAKVWQFDEAKGNFAPVTAPWSFDPYDALFFEGQPYFIEFLKTIRVGTTTVPFKSELYPGTDPRQFRVDLDGTLWIEDFEAGLFHLERGRFVRQPGLSEKGSGVATDVQRKVRYLLHYTKGVIVQREGQADQLVDLSSLENMRDLLLDPETGDVWVGGWTSLVRLRPDGQSFGKQEFRVR